MSTDQKCKKDREDFERCARTLGYDGPLRWCEDSQTYGVSAETALFTGFMLGLKFKKENENVN